MSEVRVVENYSSWDGAKAIISKPAFVRSAVFAVLILAIVIALIVIFTGRNGSSDVAIDYSTALVVSDERDLWALDLTSQKKTLLVKSRKGIATFDVHEKRTIYWREIDSQWVNSLSKKYRNLTQWREWDPMAVRVDSVTENVYVLDGLAGKLNVYDPKSTRFGIAVSDLKQPVDMVLDSQRGLMFIVQKFDSILKGSMDGSTMGKVIVSTSVTAVALDTQTPRLYWAEYETVESSDYDGGKRLTMTRAARATYWNLGVSGARLFWTKSVDNGLRSLWSCTPGSANICTEADVQQLPFDDPKGIEVFTGETNPGANPCESAKCGGLCLLKTVGSYSCACYLGERLKQDDKTCEPIEEYLLYARGDFIRGRITDPRRNAFVDAILPIRFRHISLKHKKTIDFDYNFEKRTFVFSDDLTINTVNLDRRDLQGTYTRDCCLRHLAYDWVSDDVYYVKDSNGITENTTIVLLKPREEAYFSKTLHRFNKETGSPGAFALEPNRGLYFFTMTLDGVTMIHKVHSKVTLFARDDVSDVDLTIDHEDQRLFWFSKDATKLYSADFEGQRLKSIYVSIVQDPRSVSVYDRYAYVANLTSIWRFDKSTGSGAVELTPRFNDERTDAIAGAKMFTRNIQKVDFNNPCALRNGDCQQFCFREPKKVVSGGSINVTDELQKSCLCKDNQLLQPNGISCA
ncbi:prolow-density lipoprotein receptor-related protein 1-like [Phymastichus coffea]|uniref:prolow-density lipoprotein receptor-related protein 1-like n=1 Tax=Phymastichus coffea TaxID=108790 RepID=UPI00273C2787|nr:prolow-density lipoprotein receptor-related protein 1-like [Phymastichus coffea]XP_058795612.1 prolow-density lipoprotein receptor-related protein 1-like [Phymastichus coffea]XP_058795613.1 prolow-density lipoprotein receptor-related protein 1-like [Phymastichus coffea]